MNQHFQVGGEYRFEVRREGQVRIDTGWVPNIVTNYGLDQLMGRSVNPTAYCRVGTGSTAPAATQTTLASQLTSTNNVTSYTSTNEGSPNYSCLTTLQYTFSLGVVVGNVAEVGVGATASGSDLFSRALILDGGGSPTTISLTATDQLIITYRLRTRFALTDSTGTVTLAAVSYGYTLRAHTVGSQTNVGSIAGASDTSTLGFMGTTVQAKGTGATLGAVTTGPSGGSNGSGSASTSMAAYTAGTYYRDCTVTLTPSSQNPTGGIVTLELFTGSGNAYWQMAFSPAIPKDNTKQLVLTFRTTVARYP